MPLDFAGISPAIAWDHLQAEEWTPAHARHLLSRIGFSAAPERVAQAYNLGLKGTLEEAFGKIRLMPTPAGIADYVNTRADARATRRGGAVAMMSEQQLQQFRRDITQAQRQAFLDCTRDWLAFARQPENSAQENLVMFLGNVYVVAETKVRDPEWMFYHSHLLRSMWRKPAPDLVKQVTFSPAMIDYLDLGTSYVGAPNENYARELMELFTLGEGHYSESDVKEGARALTGIIVRFERGYFARERWDGGYKTILGRTYQYGPQDFIDQIFRQPAARTQFPKRFLAYYLTDETIPAPYLDELGLRWSQRGWTVNDLASLVFSSRFFYQPYFRRTMIKSPIQYYLGLCQDLNLDVPPFAGPVYQLLRGMGQEPFNPPNVRGWVGGKSWINSSTLSARRQLVQQMFTPVNFNALNADQQMMLNDAQNAGMGAIAVSPARLRTLAAKPNEQIANELLGYFLAGEKNDAYRDKIIDYLENRAGPRLQAVRDVSIALFQSPEYNLC